MWKLVLLIQFIIFCIGLFVGTKLLHLRFRIALVATILMMPVPLFKVSPGALGFIFASDILAVGFVIAWFLGQLKNDTEQRLSIGMVSIVVAILVILPFLTTVLCYISSSAFRDVKYVLLSHARGIGYMTTFFALAVIMRKVREPANFLFLQAFLFFLVVACGLIQYGAGINLDLWNQIRLIDFRDRTFGGGFMGLYRGAVGAWGIGILGIAATILPSRKYGTWLLAFLVPSAIGVMLGVGTRQGVAIGVMVFFIGLWRVVRGIDAEKRWGVVFRSIIGLCLIAIIGAFGITGLAGPKFKEYIDKRFSFLLSRQNVQREFEIRDAGKNLSVYRNFAEHPDILIYGVGYGTDGDTFGGRSLLYIDSEIFLILQSNGLPYFLLYIVFLIMLRLKFRRSSRYRDPSGNLYVLAAITALYGGIFLLWGHFFLLNIGPHQAPVAYWNWALFGGAAGLCSSGYSDSSENTEDEWLDDTAMEMRAS